MKKGYFKNIVKKLSNNTFATNEVVTSSQDGDQKGDEFDFMVLTGGPITRRTLYSPHK